MATRCPFATYDPLGPQTQPTMTAHDVVTVHTMAGYFAYTDEMFHQNGFGGLESHFGIRADGFAKQWQDTDRTADANGEGNPRCISIETEDHGPAFAGYWNTGSDVPPWTDAQIDKLVAVIGWCCDTYDIPKVLIPDSKPGRRGIGYHRQGIDPWRVEGGEVWSTHRGKVCPGDRRIRQLIDIVIPRVQGDDDMAFDDDAKAALDRIDDRVERHLILDRDKFLDPAAHPVGRKNAKSLVQGALLDGLRESETPGDGRGVLREVFIDLIREAMTPPPVTP